ncbi:MAG: hypothetical protein K2Y26_17925 [Gemmatimonadaceae bacterium]|nr:hypothetical protein [Gemmatimonadaceae bacterium]
MLVLTSILAMGCYRTPHLVPGADAVVLTFSQEAVRGCTSKGLLRASDGRGGLLYKGAARTAVERKLKNEGRQKGATVVLLAEMKNGFWGSSAQGEAFACAP